MKVLIACEFSGIVREAFKAKGHDAWSCDLLDTEIPGQHIRDDIVKILYDGYWDLMIAHPPCTYLANSGVRWLYGENSGLRWGKLLEALEFWNTLWIAPIDKKCMENPIPHKYAKTTVENVGVSGIGNYSQIIQPWQFGHGETKATCLWLKNLPKLEPTNIVGGRKGRVHREPPGPDRWKNRSRTYQGIAEAMANQWG